MQKIKTFFSNIPRFLNSVYFIFLIFLLLLVSIGLYFVQPIMSPEYEQLNLLFFLAAAGILLGISLALKKCKLFSNLTKRFNKKSRFLIWFFILLFCLFACNYFIISNYIYSPVGDTNAVNYALFQYVEPLFGGNIADYPNLNPEYLQTVIEHLENHRNLLFIAGWYKQVYYTLINFDLSFLTKPMAAMVVNISKGLEVYVACEWLSCLCVDGAVVCCVFSIRKLTNSFISIVCFIFMILFVGLSPNCVSTYTDPYSLFIACMMFFLYVCVNNKVVKCVLYPFLFIVGYNIKPTTVAVGLAIIVVEFCKWIGKNKDFKGAIKQLPSKFTTAKFWNHAKNYVIFALMIPLTLFITSSISSFGIEINESMQLPFTHYLMLGTNNINDGRYFSGEEYLTTSYATTSEKMQANLEVVRKRFFNNPPHELAILFAKKAIIAYGSGSFKPKQYYYFSQVHEENPVLTAFYDASISTNEEIIYNNARSDGYCVFNIMEQILWFMALLSVLAFLYKKRTDSNTYVLTLSLLMITVFLLLFEGNERYMFLYSLFPVMLMGRYLYAVQQGEYELSFKKLAADLSPKKVFKRRKKAEPTDNSETSETNDKSQKPKKPSKSSKSKKTAKTTKPTKTSSSAKSS